MFPVFPLLSHSFQLTSHHPSLRLSTVELAVSRARGVCAQLLFDYLISLVVFEVVHMIKLVGPAGRSVPPLRLSALV